MSFDTAIGEIQKQYGKEAIFKMSEKLPVESIPTGSILLDAALGVGGLPKGRVVELYGGESAGKTTLALHIIAQAQKLGIKVVFIDAEHALDCKYASNIGVDISNVYIAQPNFGEEALDIVETIVRGEEESVIVIDSVAALVPRAEYEGEAGESVTNDTPIFVKKNGVFDIIPIEDLYGGSFKFSENRYTNRYKKFKGKGNHPVQVLTSSGWKNLKIVFLKKNYLKKPIIVTKTGSGLAQTTPDHSLFVNNSEIKPSELKVGQFLDIKEPEKNNFCNFITEDVAWLLGFFCAEGGFHRKMLVFTNTNKMLLEQTEKKIRDSFCVDVYWNITEHSIEDKTNRKTLYHLMVSTRADLYEIFNQTYSKKSKFKKVPDFILNSTENIKKAFLEGFIQGDGNHSSYMIGSLVGFRFYTSSFVLASGLNYILHCLNIQNYLTTQVNKDCSDKIREVEFIIGHNSNKTQRYKNNEIRKFYQLKVPEYLYDIETEDGTFVGGINFIVHHNSHMGLQARMMSQALRKLSGLISKTNSIVIFINQMRMKIGSYGNPEITTGGHALKFYASIRLDIRRREKIVKNDVHIGDNIHIKVVKNKVAPPFREVDSCIIYGKGILIENELLEHLVIKGVIDKAGSWFKYKDQKIQGQENMAKYIKENLDEFLKLINKEIT
jgi:RecA/RadA recombinase